MSFLAGWIALGCGLLNLLGRKGTTGHRALGLLFAIAMCLVAIDAASRAATWGGVDPVGALSLVATGATIWAVLPFVARRRGWVRRHARRMQGAYAALAAAGADEVLLTQLSHWRPEASQWPIALALACLVAVAGWWLARQQRAEVRRVTEAFE